MRIHSIKRGVVLIFFLISLSSAMINLITLDINRNVQLYVLQLIAVLIRKKYNDKCTCLLIKNKLAIQVLSRFLTNRKTRPSSVDYVGQKVRLCRDLMTS